MEHIHTGRKAKTQKARWHAQTMNFAILQSSRVKSLAQQLHYLRGPSGSRVACTEAVSLKRRAFSRRLQGALGRWLYRKADLREYVGAPAASRLARGRRSTQKVKTSVAARLAWA